MMITTDLYERYVPSPFYFYCGLITDEPRVRIIERVTEDWINVTDVPETEVLRATEVGYCGA